MKSETKVLMLRWGLNQFKAFSMRAFFKIGVIPSFVEYLEPEDWYIMKVFRNSMRILIG
jgi:hypothetical protein